jgi:ABC-type transport system substrate-binding protein
MSFLSALLLISFGVCAPDSTLHVGIPAIPLVMDPMKADDTLSLGILSHIYETLYSFDSSTPSKKAIPQLAAALPSYSSDGTSAKIFIRSDARYSDGTPVRAQDFVDAVKRLQDLKSHPTALDLLDKLLVGVKAIDDLTLEFKLKGPQLKVEDVFSQLYTTPKAIGSGPFLQSLTKESGQILLIRNRHFHPEFYRERRLPFIDRILYHQSVKHS